MNEVKENPPARLVRVLEVLEISTSTFYRKKVPPEKRKPKGPQPDPIPKWMEDLVVGLANQYPYFGYKKIAILCRRQGSKVSNKKAYRIYKLHGLLRKPKPRKAEVHQAAKLFELLPQGPNELWQTDVTYIHIPGHGWWYAVTVIDYYSRYLLACHLTASYSAKECIKAIDIARKRAEAIQGPLKKTPFLVTDNGSSFLARAFRDHIAEQYSHVRIQYRTPTQLGLLERFHGTLKNEEVYFNLYANPGECRDSLEKYRNIYNNVRPHWALVPEKGGDPCTPEDIYCKAIRTKIPPWQTWAKAAKEKLDRMLTEEDTTAA